MDVKRDRPRSTPRQSIRELLSGGDRRSIAQSSRVRAMIDDRQTTTMLRHFP